MYDGDHQLILIVQHPHQHRQLVLVRVRVRVPLVFRVFEPVQVARQVLLKKTTKMNSLLSVGLMIQIQIFLLTIP